MTNTIPTATGRGRHNLLAVDVGGIPKQLANANGVGQFLVKNIAQRCKNDKTVIQEGVVDYQTMLEHPPAINNAVVILAGVKSLDTSLGILGATITMTTVPVPDLKLYNVHSMTITLTAERKHHDIRPPHSATITYTQKYDSFTRVAHGTLPASVLKKTREFSKSVSNLNLLEVDYRRNLKTVGQRKEYICKMLDLMEKGLAVEANMVQLSLNKGINAEVFFAYRVRAQDFSFATILDKYAQSIADKASRAHQRGMVLGSEAEMVDIANAYAKQVTRDVFALARDPANFIYTFLRRTTSTSSIYNHQNGSKLSMEGKMVGGVIFVTKDVMQQLAPYMKYGAVTFEKPIHYLPHEALTTTNNGTRVVMCIKEYKSRNNASTKGIHDTKLSDPLRSTDREHEILLLTNLGNTLLQPNPVDDPKNLPYSESEEYIVGVIKRKIEDVPYVIYEGNAYPLETVENDIPETNLSSKIRHLCYVRYGWHNKDSESLHYWAQKMPQSSISPYDKYSFNLPTVMSHTPGIDAAQVIFGPNEMIYALLNPFFFMGEYHTEKLNNMLQKSKLLQGRSCIWVKDMMINLIYLAKNRQHLLRSYWENSDFWGEPIGDGKKALRELLMTEISPFYDLVCQKNSEYQSSMEMTQFSMIKRELFGCFPNYVVPPSIRELRGNKLLCCLSSDAERAYLAEQIGTAKALLYDRLQKNIKIVFCDQYDYIYTFVHETSHALCEILSDMKDIKLKQNTRLDPLSGVLREIVKIYMKTFIKLFVCGIHTDLLRKISYLYTGNTPWRILIYCVLPVLCGGNMYFSSGSLEDDDLEELNKPVTESRKRDKLELDVDDEMEQRGHVSSETKQASEKPDKSLTDHEEVDDLQLFDDEDEIWYNMQSRAEKLSDSKNAPISKEIEAVFLFPPGEKILEESHDIFATMLLGNPQYAQNKITPTMSHNMYSLVNEGTANDLLKISILMMDFIYNSPYAISKCILSGIHPGFEVDFVKLEETISSEALFVKPLAIDVIMTDGVINVENENADKSANFNITCNMKIASNSFSTGSMVAKNIYPAPSIGSLNRTCDAKPKLSIDFFTRSEYVNAFGLIGELKKTNCVDDADIKAMKNIYDTVTAQEGYYLSHSMISNRTGINNDQRYVPIIAPATRKTPISDIMCLTGIPLCHATCNCSDKTPSEVFFTQISPFLSSNPYSSNFGGVNQMIFTPSNTMLCEGFHMETFNYLSSDSSVDVTTATIEEIFNINNKLSNKMSLQECWLINNRIKQQQVLNTGQDTEMNSTPYNGLMEHPVMGEDDVPLRFGYMTPYTQYTDTNIMSELNKENFTPGGDMKVGKSPMMYAVRSPFTI